MSQEGYGLRSRQGFSLIELIIVVVIIGILSAIAIPRLSRGTEGASINAFVNEINNLAKAIDQYQVESGNQIADSSTGVLPTELADCLNANSWKGQTPLGGQWDIARDESGIVLAVGVHYMSSSPDEDALRQADAILDDGDLTTGAFRKIAANRYYLVLKN